MNIQILMCMRLCMSLCACICVYVSVCLRISLCMSLHLCMSLRMSICVCVYVCVFWSVATLLGRPARAPARDLSRGLFFFFFLGLLQGKRVLRWGLASQSGACEREGGDEFVFVREGGREGDRQRECMCCLPSYIMLYM
jgi:hypothetical protein